jgi:hypothetical protein
VKTRVPHRLERLLEFGEVHFGEIVAVLGGHGGPESGILYCIVRVQHGFSAGHRRGDSPFTRLHNADGRGNIALLGSYP